MRSRHLRWILLLVIGGLVAHDRPSDSAGAAELADPAVENRARDVVAKSLPYLQQAGQKWIDQKKCVSCHQVSSMVWSLNAASRSGFDIDQSRLSDWNEWAIDWQHFNAPPKEGEQRSEAETAAGNIDTMAQLLLTFRYGDQRPAWATAFVEHLQQNQLESGAWKACGQLPSQKRPAVETQQVTTMWTLLALQRNGWKNEEAIQRARDWLSDELSATSTEWWVVRYLLESEFGDAEIAAAARQKLLGLQREDGGWGWLTEEESDAFATGLALYALAHDPQPAHRQAARLGIAYLADSQQESGEWKVRGTKKSGRKRFVPTATYWGTAWAVIGTSRWLKHD